tara:strand:+ start:361 stop:606 length:246 start_codon:yes stop_codon:yes gene_type:complete
MICFTILGNTLCGRPYKEPSKKAAKNGMLCNDCIQVIWKEQYRRNTLLKVKVKVNEDDIMEEHDDSEERGSRLYLIDFKKP